MEHPIYALLPLVNSSAAASDFVIRATSAPDLFSFAFLLHHPSLRTHITSSDASLLRIFASGTWADYKKLSAPVQLSEAQTTKLKQLTLVTLAGKSHKLSYATLYSVLDLVDARELASLVVSCVYSNLLSAALDTRAQVVNISAVRAGRDVVGREEILQLKSVVDTWSIRCATTIAELASESRKVREASIKESADVREYNRVVEMINAQLMPRSKHNNDSNSGSNGNNNVAEEGSDAMEIDDGASPMSDSSINKKRK